MSIEDSVKIAAVEKWLYCELTNRNSQAGQNGAAIDFENLVIVPVSDKDVHISYATNDRTVRGQVSQAINRIIREAGVPRNEQAFAENEKLFCNLNLLYDVAHKYRPANRETTYQYIEAVELRDIKKWVSKQTKLIYADINLTKKGNMVTFTFPNGNKDRDTVHALFATEYDLDPKEAAYGEKPKAGSLTYGLQPLALLAQDKGHGRAVG